ncbi:MAG: hypothetical protein ACRDRT_06240, partial [Pseudonocardiaceae bacterium]
VLPGLEEASDGPRMVSALSALLDQPIDACLPTLVRYRSGTRAVVRYTLRNSIPSAGIYRDTVPYRDTVLYGKIASSSDSTRLWTNLATIHHRAAQTPDMPDVAETVGVISRLAMVVQHAATGTPLRDRLFGSAVTQSDALSALNRAGRHLAAFHHNGQPPTTVRTLSGDTASIRTSLSTVSLANAELANRIAMGLDQLDQQELDDGALVASHGSFRADHLLLEDGNYQAAASRATVIDIDGYCAAAPERDAANLLAFITWKAIRQPEHRALVALAREAFSAGYRSAGPALDSDRLRSFLAVCMLRIAVGRFRNLTVAEWPMVPTLVDTAIAEVTNRTAP